MHWALGAPWTITDIGDFTGTPTLRGMEKPKQLWSCLCQGPSLTLVCQTGVVAQNGCPLLSGSGLSPPCNVSCPELGWYVQPA